MTNWGVRRENINTFYLNPTDKSELNGFSLNVSGGTPCSPFFLVGTDLTTIRTSVAIKKRKKITSSQLDLKVEGNTDYLPGKSLKTY